jgi:hypothetical protein
MVITDMVHASQLVLINTRESYTNRKKTVSNVSIYSSTQAMCPTEMYNQRKRRAERDSKTLSALLEGIRCCILRLREDCHILFVTAGEDSAARKLRDSAAHFMRCCLHMYNLVEEGLNYLDDPASNALDVDATMTETELLIAMVNTAPRGLFDCGLHMVLEPASMLVSMLQVMREEMANPTDHAFMQKQRADWGGAPMDKSMRKLG